MATAPLKLIYVDDELPGITRRRAGRGWAYYDPQGKLIRDAQERQRLNAVALPPAYSDAWFCPAANGHILATGVDDRGRKQYRYHPDFRLMREGEKFDMCLAFGKLLPLVRKRVEQDLRTRSMGRDKVLAGVVRLLDLGAVRIGNAGYARENRSFGATTLRHHHAEVSGRTLQLRYRGKGGKQRDIKLQDARLATFVQRMKDMPGQQLFQWLDDDGTAHEVNSSCVNAYLSETMGKAFTAKNFRTWHASVMGYRLLSQAEDRLTISAILEAVAERLGNTPAVARKSYIHPAVIDLVTEQEDWRSGLQIPRETRWMDRSERGLVALLEDSPTAGELLNAA